MESLSIFLFISITLYQFSNGQVSSSYWIADHDIDYSTTFDGNEKWYKCPEGYVIGGFYKSDIGDFSLASLLPIEKIRCVRPNTTDILSQTCLEKDVESEFDTDVSVYCPDGHFINGIYSATKSQCGFYCWEAFNCCQYTPTQTGQSFGVTVGIIQYKENDWDSCFAGDNIWCTVSNQTLINGFAKNDNDNSLTPYTRSFHVMIKVNVKVTACNGWRHATISKSMRLQISDIHGTSEYFYVNKGSGLPTNENTGNTLNYDHYMPDIDELHQVKIMVDDEYGFCISNLVISYNNKQYVFDGPDYFGNGIILANHCDNNYVSVSENQPLMPCKTGFLDLSTYAPRGIYNLDIHSCIGDNNGISVENMKDDVYVTIMGRKTPQKTYTTTTISYLDHIKPAEVNIIQLGDLIAGNVLITDTPANALYSEVEGNLIGIKVEALHGYKFESDDWLNIKIGDNDKSIYTTMVFDGDAYYVAEDGKYLVVFFYHSSRHNLKKADEIYIYGEDVADKSVNVFGIFEGKEEEYGLSFRAQEEDSNINWFDANDKCNTLYGTSLASIHSEEEHFLIRGFLGLYMDAWIGFQDITSRNSDNWQWVDRSIVDYTNWARGQPQTINDCVWLPSGIEEWWSSDCNALKERFVCSSPHWPANTHRTFEINVPELIDDITLVSIGNNNKQDNLCIDSVTINEKTATYLSDNIIGGNTGPSALSAIIKYPVCKTEVTGFRVDHETSTATLIGGDSTIAGLECKNANRLIPSTCSISQSYELSKTTSFAISNENSATSEYSWGSSSSISLGTSSSTSTSDEFSYGFDQSVSVGVTATAEFGLPGIASGSIETSVETSVGSNQQWTSSTEKSQESSTETTNENNQQNTESNTATDGTESAWDTTQTTTIECSAEIEVPPSHSVGYALIFNAYNTSITTYTDMKLTLCSAFTDPANSNDSSHYVYLKDIKGKLNHKETTACEVQFNPATYIRNAMTCEEEQRLAFSSGSNYVPRCRENEPKLYDGCQCDIGDTETLAQCMCVDETGNMLTNKFMYVEDGDDWRRICVEELKCADSSVVNVSQ